MKCPKCSQENNIVKNGTTHNNRQRYLCRDCSFNFSIFSKRGMSDETKVKAIELHFNGLSFRKIGEILCVSSVTVLRWIRNARRKLRQILRNRLKTRYIQLKNMDFKEMWQYTLNARQDIRLQLMDLV